MTEKPDEIRYYYFVFTQGNKYGLLFDKHKSKNSIIVPVDSIFKKEWANSIDVYSNLQKSNITLLSEFKEPDSGIVKLQYKFQLKTDADFNGIISYYFTKNLKHLQYSFSKQLDSLMNMKLFRVEIVNNARYLKGYNMHIEKIYQYYFLENEIINDENTLLEYFKADRKISRKR